MFSVWYPFFKIVLHFEETKRSFFGTHLLKHVHKISVCDMKCMWVRLFTEIVVMEAFNWQLLHTQIKGAKGKTLEPVITCTEVFYSFCWCPQKKKVRGNKPQNTISVHPTKYNTSWAWVRANIPYSSFSGTRCSHKSLCLTNEVQIAFQPSFHIAWLLQL